MNFITDNEKDFLTMVKESRGFKSCTLPIHKCGYSTTCVILADDENFYENVRGITRKIVQDNQFKKPIDRFEIDYYTDGRIVISFINLEENRALCNSVYPKGSYMD